ncbi:hypothetical protein ACIBQ2_07395 [Micromonospora sediminimaris]
MLGSNLARGVDKAEEHHGRVGEEVALSASTSDGEAAGQLL